ncbi:unnamed protein product [Periconia digitata]|uniref:Uncharacterized protein n=1 Tax=Periconia digitata TaxID=1303443 RepID=A0A9W4UA76_9PLEO|nr:unnamed protein product [Periconia digitata]
MMIDCSSGTIPQMCLKCRKRSPLLPASLASASRTTSLIVQRPYTVQFIIGTLESPENIPRPSVYMPSTLATRSSYLRRRIHPPYKGEKITKVVLVEAYYDALVLYKSWLQHGVVPKFRRSSHTPIPTLEGTLLWSECFDLVRAHVMGTRFEHGEFSDYVMDELVRWLDPTQEPNIEALDFVFRENGVSEELQRFVVDRMFAVEEHIRKIFLSFLERKLKGKLGIARQARLSEYHVGDNDADCEDSQNSETEDDDSTAEFSSEDERASFGRHQVAMPNRSPTPPMPPNRSLSTRHALREFHREYDPISTAIREPRSPYLMRSYSSFQRPVPFPPAEYLASAKNDAVVRRYDVRRKPLPSLPMSFKDDSHPIVRHGSLPTLRPAIVVSMDGENEKRLVSRTKGKHPSGEATELEGRTVTPEELLESTPRADSPSYEE